MLNLDIKSFKKKRFLITGGLGFVGVNLVKKLLENDIKPIVIDFVPDMTFIDYNYVPFSLDKIDFLNMDITEKNRITEVIKEHRPDIVIHLASITDLTKDFDTAFKSINTNIKGTLNILKGIYENNVDKFLFLSTSDVYGGIDPPFRENQYSIPSSPYSVSKLSAEMYCLLFHQVFALPVVILRSFNLYGCYQKPVRVIPYVITKLLQNETVPLTLGEQKREFNHVYDLISAIFMVLNSKEIEGKTINIGCGKSISIRDITTMIAKELNSEHKLDFGAISYRPNEIWDMYCDNSLAKEILNWSPQIELKNGLKQTIEWYKEMFQT
jgi:nucleoside-diphosphate-sugar epimerase